MIAGIEFDKRLVDYFIESLNQEYKINIEEIFQNKKVIEKLILEAKKVKENLSFSKEVTTLVNLIY